MKQFDNTVDSYPALVDWVIEHGDDVTTRGLETYEIQDVTLQFTSPKRKFIEGLDVGLTFTEIDTVKEGSEPEKLASAAADSKLDLSDGVFYEPEVRASISQNWDDARTLIKEDNGTRRAVFTFGDDLESPCVIRFQLLLRRGSLHAYTYLRSQDLLYAYPIDTALFQTYQQQMAQELDVSVGTYNHHATSFHLYKRDELEAKMRADRISNYAYNPFYNDRAVWSDSAMAENDS